MSQPKIKVLLVEDDQVLGFVVKDFLQKHNFEVCYCSDSDEAWQQFMRNKYSLCLIDVLLPGKKDGIALANSIRQKNTEIPILILSSKKLSADILSGFENGADDYIIKPFNLNELILRMRVFLRRNSKEENSKPDTYKIGDLTFDYQSHTLGDDKIEYHLTDREADLMFYLCQNENTVIRREDILLAIWGKDDFFLGRSMDVYITKIRKYLKTQSKVKLETIHGIGFKFKTCINRNHLAETYIQEDSLKQVG